MSGSGVSYTSPRYGWTCDTVSQFEIVLADGSITQVEANSNSDLAWALKGGVNNFGDEYLLVASYSRMHRLLIALRIRSSYRPRATTGH